MVRTKTREIKIKESEGIFSILKKTSTAKEDYDFESLSILRQILSNEKARLLHVIKTERPNSIYELAKKLNRSFKSVWEDINLLRKFGFIGLSQERRKNRIRHKPEVVVDKMIIEVNL